MRIVSENPFSGKTYFYTIASRMFEKGNEDNGEEEEDDDDDGMPRPPSSRLRMLSSLCFEMCEVYAKLLNKGGFIRQLKIHLS